MRLLCELTIDIGLVVDVNRDISADDLFYRGDRAFPRTGSSSAGKRLGARRLQPEVDRAFASSLHSDSSSAFAKTSATSCSRSYPRAVKIKMSNGARKHLARYVRRKAGES